MCPGMGGFRIVAGSRSERWKTGWILTLGGRPSLYALDPIFSRIG
jgi:hypothetical protein